jgi:hypothetical protein
VRVRRRVLAGDPPDRIELMKISKPIALDFDCTGSDASTCGTTRTAEDLAGCPIGSIEVGGGARQARTMIARSAILHLNTYFVICSKQRPPGRVDDQM